MLRLARLLGLCLLSGNPVVAIAPLSAEPPGNVTVVPATVRMDLEQAAEVSVSWEHDFAEDGAVNYYRVCATTTGACGLADPGNLVVNVEAGASETRLRLAPERFQGHRVWVTVAACSGAIATTCDSAVTQSLRWVPPPPGGRREIDSPSVGLPSSVVWKPVAGASDYLLCLGRDRPPCPDEATAPSAASSADPVVIRTRATREDVTARRFPQFHGGRLAWSVASCALIGERRVCGAYAAPDRQVTIPRP